MAHKTLVGGTAYDVTGGKTLVNGTVYNITGGKTLVGGTAYDISFGSQGADGGWPADLYTGLEFVSANPFTISVTYPQWDGTLEYTNGSGWGTWGGGEISSGESSIGQCIYIRGTKNTKITYVGLQNAWTLNGTDIQCNGNIENLLDYPTVKAGEHPAMGKYCCCGMFYNCTSITTAPTLPAAMLSDSCYDTMFRGCTSLTTGPSLPATVLSNGCYTNMFVDCISLTTIPILPATALTRYCYQSMFSGCKKIKLSSTATGTYNKPYRIPHSGTGTTDTNSLVSMFANTGGTYTGWGYINTTYYVDESNTIV